MYSSELSKIMTPVPQKERGIRGGKVEGWHAKKKKNILDDLEL